MKYMPFIQMTRRTKEIIESFDNENIIPYISLIDNNDTGTEKKTETYNELSIHIPHFVDLTSTLTKKDTGISVVNINGDNRSTFRNIRIASSEDEMGLRFHTQDFNTIKNILDMIFDVSTLHVIIEIGHIDIGINKETITRIIDYSIANELDIKTYILASSIPSNINTVCTSSSQSVIDNEALLAFNALDMYDERVNFGDYCGYEVSTPSEYVQGMRIVPKTIMLSTNASQILIVRTCNIEYKWKQGMSELLNMLKTDDIYENFTHDIDDCEGCSYLLNPNLDKSTPEFIKVACMKHNIRSMSDFVEYFNSIDPDNVNEEHFF